MREQAGFDMILLDLDGTLIDSEKGIVNSVIYALEKFGIEKESVFRGVDYSTKFL